MDEVESQEATHYVHFIQGFTSLFGRHHLHCRRRHQLRRAYPRSSFHEIQLMLIYHAARQLCRIVS